jgi:hypothetical protein
VSPDDTPAERPQPPNLEVLAAAAETMHDMYLTYIAAGFTEAQAMQIIIGMIQASIHP